MRNRSTVTENWALSTERMDREGMHQPKAPGVGLHPQCCSGCNAGLSVQCGALQTLQLERTAGVEVRASPSVPPERLHEPPCPLVGRGRGGRVPGRAWHPGRLYDLPLALPRPRASGNFQKPYIPRPPWVCEYLYLCVSVEIFRWLFPSRTGVKGPS